MVFFILVALNGLWHNRYEKRKRRSDPHTFAYHFMGYSSLYPFYYFPEKVRMRLRLVIVLRP